jgi:AraC-like DNA-binding protein
MDARLQMALSAIEQMITAQDFEHRGPIHVELLAAQSGLSRYQLLRLFQKEMRGNLNEYILRLRMQAAASCIAQTNQPILDIALGLGYGGQQAFTRAFSKFWGISPHQLRAEQSKLCLLSGAHAVAPCAKVAIRVRQKPTLFWQRRYQGTIEQFGLHWQQFALEADALLQGYTGSFFAVIYDDSAVCPADLVRYGCAIEVPFGNQQKPADWLSITFAACRFVTFEFYGNYAEEQSLLRPQVMQWFRQSRESFGAAGTFVQYPQLPCADPGVRRAMVLWVSLAN